MIKIEPLQGDNTRRLKGSVGDYFAMYNRNKSSLCLDLKSDQRMATAGRIIDLMIENFRAGAMDKLGLGYDALSESNPGLIYCSLKGFLSGPCEHRTALDNGETIKLPNLPIEFDGSKAGLRKDLPQPGQGAREHLASLGFSGEELDQMVNQGVMVTD